MSWIACAAVATALSLAAAGVAAETPSGIRFDLIPVGCRISGVYSDGSVSIDEYIGRHAGKPVVKTYGDPNNRDLLRTTTFNAEGWMVKKVWAAGQWETFGPYSCFAQPGSCVYAYQNSEGARETYRGNVQRDGKDLVSSGGFVGQDPFPPTRLRLDSWNSIAAYSAGSVSYSITAYKNCGDAVPSR